MQEYCIRFRDGCTDQKFCWCFYGFLQERHHYFSGFNVWNLGKKTPPNNSIYFYTLTSSLRLELISFLDTIWDISEFLSLINPQQLAAAETEQICASAWWLSARKHCPCFQRRTPETSRRGPRGMLPSAVKVLFSDSYPQGDFCCEKSQIALKVMEMLTTFLGD